MLIYRRLEVKDKEGVTCELHIGPQGVQCAMGVGTIIDHVTKLVPVDSAFPLARRP